jgi:hypothetical protein
MSQAQLLIHVVAALEAASIPYMITGSTVSSMQGEARSTHDIDIVVTLRPPAIPALLAAFPAPRFYVDQDAIRDAIVRCGTFNVLDSEGGDKIDFWILKPDPFDQSMFQRRYRETALGIELCVSQPEDTILSKLRWAKMCGGSEKQMTDCRGVYEVNFSHLDPDYLRQWAAVLGVEDLLERIRREAQP